MGGQAKKIRLCLKIAAWSVLAVADLHADDNGRGTKAIGMANAFTAVGDNAWGLRYNPAGLASIRTFECSAFLVPSQFELPELRTTALAAAIPFPSFTGGILVEQFGFDLFKESKLSIGAGLPTGRSVWIGFAASILHFSIERYGSSQSLQLDLGTMVSLNSYLDVGVALHNITAASIGRSHERLPQDAEVGLRCVPFDGCVVAVEVEKDVRFEPSLKLGIAQRLSPVIAVEVGGANHPEKFSIGIQIFALPLVFGYATYSHQVLGWTHQIEVTFMSVE